jgi:hypothetical protein
MAGAGYKLFATGDVLTAAQVNTYLNEQTVMVFADSAARTTALSGVLAEGMMSYLQDTNSVEVYNGTAFVAVGGGGLTSPLTTKGDIWVYGTSDTRLGVGTDGHTLVADSVETTGLKWVAPAGSPITTEGDLVIGDASGDAVRLPIGALGTVLTSDGDTADWAAPAGGGGANWSLLNAGGTALTGAATITVSGISGKDKIMVLIAGASSASASSYVGLRFNADSASNYYTYGAAISAPSTYAPTFLTQENAAFDQVYIALMSASANSVASGYCLISGTNAAGDKVWNSAGSASAATSNTQVGFILGGYYDSASTISSVSILTSAGNFDAGTIYIYTSA